MRLGVYADLLYRRDEDGLSADRAFVKFVTSLPPRVREIVLFGRLDPEPGRYPYRLPADHVRLVAFPHYERLWDAGSVLRALPKTRAVFAAELEHLDAVWLFGPHPLALELARIARRRRVPVVLGIRQDYPLYVRNRIPSAAWRWTIPAASFLDLAFRKLAKQAPTVVVGTELARKYGGNGAPLLTTAFSLITRHDIVSLDSALARPWDGELRVLSVGRLDPEKNPLLLLEVADRLRERDPRWRLVVVGDGPLRGALEDQVRARGLIGVVELRGYVQNGPSLWDEYRTSHAFLHVSMTEGLPQVLVEAQAAGLPIVATAVGGVPEALGAGARLVAPNDASAIVDALEELAADGELRHRLVTQGIRDAAGSTMELQLDAVASFFERYLHAVKT